MIPFYLLFGLLAITIFYVILVVSLEFTLFIFNLSRATFEWYDTTSHICYLTTIEFHFPLTSSYLTENFIHCFFKYFFLSCFSLFPFKDSTYTYIRPHGVVSQFTGVLFLLLLFFSLCYSLWFIFYSFYYYVFRFTDVFFCNVLSVGHLIQYNFHLRHCSLYIFHVFT